LWKKIYSDIVKKILILSRDFNHKGGVVNYVKLLIQNLSKENFETEHFVQGRSSIPLKNIFLPFIILYQLITFKKTLRKSMPDLVHINPSLYLRSLLRDSLYIEIINNFHFETMLVMFHGCNKSLADKIINNFFFSKIFRCIYKKPSLILVLCNQIKQQLVKIGIPSEKVKVTTTMYQNGQVAKQYYHSRANNKVKILFMSRLVESKGLYIAAEVGRLLVNNDFKNLKLIFAGDGPEYKGLKRYINKYELNDYVDVPGYITGEKKREILECSDIFLFPSSSEGCPIVILEAMGAGLAVVTTPVGAIPDIVKNNKNGFIINSKDPKDFYEAIKRLIEDRELLNRIQKLNRKEAEENYEAKVVTKKMESIYFSIINGVCPKVTGKVDMNTKEGLQPLKNLISKKEVVALWTNSKSRSSFPIRYQKMVSHSTEFCEAFRKIKTN